jgi:hypothetical protein
VDEVAAIVREADEVQAVARPQVPHLVVRNHLVPLVRRIGDAVRQVQDVHGK